MSLLLRFLDRIGIDDADKHVLEDEGITDISQLMACGRTAGSAFAKGCIGIAIDYLKERFSQYKRPLPAEVLEDLLKIKEWRKNSWEVFLFQKFDHAYLLEWLKLVDSMRLTKAMSQSDPSCEDSSSTELTDSDVRKLEEKTKKSNWKCNLDTEEVDLYPCIDSDADSDDVFLSDDENKKFEEDRKSEALISIPFKVCGPLYRHQLDGIERITSNYENGKGGLILCDEMGLVSHATPAVWESAPLH
jgi:SNF2 family DNA or RNA helicase